MSSGPALAAPWCSGSNRRVAGPAASLFPPQARDWGLPGGVRLTPHGAERVARECARAASFDDAAKSLGVDWHCVLDAKQLQRWGEALGDDLMARRDQEALDCQAGKRPEGPENPPALLVVGLDGGRVQMREKDPCTQSRWKENKLLSITSYLPGDGKDKPPAALVTTAMATMGDAAAFEKLLAPELAKRGHSTAARVLNISDAGNWIDPIGQRQKIAEVRIIDFYHAAEHLALSCQAVEGGRVPRDQACFAHWRGELLEGKVEKINDWLGQQMARDDISSETKEVLRQTRGYFQAHGHAMHYDQYRKRGWPIGSGPTEAAIKQVNRRMKGSERFWTKRGAEAIMALRTCWLSQDQRWQHYWNSLPAYGRAA